MDFYEVTAGPATEPVSLCDTKDWCRITHDDEDLLIGSLITAATQKAELFTNRVFIERTITGKFECFQCSPYERGPFFEIRRAPLASVTTIHVYVDGDSEHISADDFEIKETSSFSRVIFSEINWSPDNIPYPYYIIFVAGYGDRSAVPEPIKTAICQMVSYWYQNRGDCDGIAEIPSIAMGILREYKILNTYG
jgi:uncharacterized phiE125 gp8 family phage protein